MMFVAAGCASAAAAVRTSRATAAVERAAKSGAGEEFPYEMTLAQAYLAKAREESSEAQYQDALRFARLSLENAERAVELQRERRLSSSVVEEEAAKKTAPAPTPAVVTPEAAQ
jgi:hypothetical protein